MTTRYKLLENEKTTAAEFFVLSGFKKIAVRTEKSFEFNFVFGCKRSIQESFNPFLKFREIAQSAPPI